VQGQWCSILLWDLKMTSGHAFAFCTVDLQMEAPPLSVLCPSCSRPSPLEKPLCCEYLRQIAISHCKVIGFGAPYVWPSLLCSVLSSSPEFKLFFAPRAVPGFGVPFFWGLCEKIWIPHATLLLYSSSSVSTPLVSGVPPPSPL